MKACKTFLLAATSVAGLFSTANAYAAVTYPAAQVHGNGASSIVNVQNKAFQCLGNPDNPIGFGGDQTTAAFPPHDYVPISPTIANPIYHCGTQSIQSQITGYYVSTGSGAGKANWSKFNLAGITYMPASFVSAYSDGHIQYAFSDSPLAQTDLDNYNCAAYCSPLGPASHGTGPAIQVPYWVLPIALAYPPIYGKILTAGVVHNLSFNVNATYVQKAADGTVTGGLRLDKKAYCKIVNGQITNWSDPALKVLNGGQSLGDPADPSFNTTGVPILLVGRQDNSGTTNLFTRAMTAQCGAYGINLAGNEFTAGGKDGLLAAYPTRVGGARYNETTGALILIPGDIWPEGGGKFGLVNGDDGVASVVGRTIPNPTTEGQRIVQGYLGYVGADFVLPATLGTASPPLYSAALQQGSTLYYKMPTAANATAAFGTTFLPPESTTTGTYNATITPNFTGSSGRRDDPLAWVLPASATDKLANPAQGYPLVGTTNALLYTCYNSPAKRNVIMAMAALHFGKLPATSTPTGAYFPAALEISTAKGADGQPLGILARNGLANLPTAWKNAIWETFFSKTHKTLTPSPDSLNLWIQDKLPTSTAEIDGNAANGEVKGNPACTPGSGG